MLTLYFTPGASSMAPHIALREIGAPFESHAISLTRKEQHAPEFLAINSEGKVPTLLIDGRRLTEVAGILWYLARRHPEAGLLPVGDIEAEAQVVSWMSFIAATVHPARRRGLDHAMGIYGLADRRLGNSEWAIGERTRRRFRNSPRVSCTCLRRRRPSSRSALETVGWRRAW